MKPLQLLSRARQQAVSSEFRHEPPALRKSIIDGLCWKSWAAVPIVLLLSALTIARLYPTYTLFTATYDEPVHIASALEWLDKGTYTYDPQHPPLGRIAIAIGPSLGGLRSHSLRGAWNEGNAILYSQGDPWRNLTLARLGSLPFLALAAAIVFLWARRWYSVYSAFAALLLFLSLPPILGHAALATNDMACAAGAILGLYQFMRWLERPVWSRSVWFGAALGLAVASKFSNLAYLTACAAVAFACLWLAGNLPRPGRKEIGIVVATAFLLVWAAYRFELTPISERVGHHPAIDKLTGGNLPLQALAYKAVELPLPLVTAFSGISNVWGVNRSGTDSYLLGTFSHTGWWYFFPVVLGVKTPLGFLVLALAGTAAVLARWRETAWQLSFAAFFAIAILLVCMASRINLGVRHILAIYPLLAVLAGHAVAQSFRHRKWRILAPLAILLVCEVIAESWIAHPDYMASFNPLAGSHPERILAESDLDWGQDLHRLSLRLKALGVKNVALAYLGSAPLETADLPPYRPLSPSTPTTGYIAVSVRYLTLEYAKDGSFGWLKSYSPAEKIGKSIYLFHIPG
jgi:4-amino-4-deoxy-L-arabinose transferase-like glycosyltransferase